MIKKQFSQAFILILFFILNLFITNKIFAATLNLESSKNSVGIGEQFYIDLMLDPENQSINAIEGSISFSNNNIYFLRAETGKSMVNLWVEQPFLKGSSINFAGVISNGFDGVIDPFNSNKKFPGMIIRLVFEAIKAGDVDFYASNFSLNLNDGLGTTIEASDTTSSVKIDDYINKFKYESNISSNPELEAYVIRDPNIFNNKYTLVFKATDKENGIKTVRIKEGKRDWKEIESPYLLIDQSRHSSITLQATNFSGASIVMNIDKVPYGYKLWLQIFIVILGVILLFVLIIKKKKIYVKKR